MFPECCCITNRHIGAREGRQLIPHVRFQVPCLGPESPLKSGFACAGLLCSLSESAQMCFFKSSAHIVRAIQEDESSQAIGSVHFFSSGLADVALRLGFVIGISRKNELNNSTGTHWFQLKVHKSSHTNGLTRGPFLRACFLLRFEDQKRSPSLSYCFAPISTALRLLRPSRSLSRKACPEMFCSNFHGFATLESGVRDLH